MTIFGYSLSHSNKNYVDTSFTGSSSQSHGEKKYRYGKNKGKNNCIKKRHKYTTVTVAKGSTFTFIHASSLLLVTFYFIEDM